MLLLAISIFLAARLCTAADGALLSCDPPSSCFEKQCQQLQARQNPATNDRIVLLRWTYPMLDLFHRSGIECKVDAERECEHYDEAFAETFARACRGGGRPCYRHELPPGRRTNDVSYKTISQHCRERYGLDFECEVRENVANVGNPLAWADADAIIFDGANTRVWNTPVLPSRRCASQLWGMYEFRPASVHTFLADDSYTSLYDFTAGYSQNWTVWSPDFIPPGDYYTRMPVAKTADAPVVVMISACRTPNNRLAYVRELMQHIEVHSYGECEHNRDFSEEQLAMPNKYRQKAAVIERYAFTLAFENSNEPDYVSEKIHNALHVGSVPVYMGAPNVADYAPSGSYIDVRDFASARELAEYLKMLLQDESKYSEYLKWKGRDPEPHMQALARNGRQHYLCQLCEYVRGVVSNNEDDWPYRRETEEDNGKSEL